MAFNLKKRLNAWRGRLQLALKRTSGSTEALEQDERVVNFSNPVVNYYRHRMAIDASSFYRFAVQTGSLDLRDLLAKVSNAQGLDFVDLLELIDQTRSRDGNFPTGAHRDLVKTFQPETLLILGDLVSNTARHDLDTLTAIKLYEFILDLYGEKPLEGGHLLHYVEALSDLGYYAQAEKVAKQYKINRFAPLQTELLALQRVRLTSSITEWLTALNELYAKLGMTQVHLLDGEGVPVLDRLTSNNSRSLEGPRVSVIIPTHSPSTGLRTAIRGLLNQTWSNLEIIIVDDASPKDFYALLNEVESYDPRIRIIHHSQNMGAYVARNTGLRAATGEFITVHDDDDWSHPDKIAMQVQVMLDDQGIVATTSGHIRTTSDLVFRRVNAEAKFLQMNYSSLMIRSSVVDKIGEWDTVNRGGDSEFYSRLGAYAGTERIVELLDKPLSFSRLWEGSLTSGEMFRGYFGYSRLMYRWAFRQWQRRASRTDQGVVRAPSSPRPYAIPSSFEVGNRQGTLGKFDVIFVTDFFRLSKTAYRVVNEIETLVDSDLRIGYMHLYSPETRRMMGFPERLFQLQLEGKVTQVGYDDVAETRLLVLCDLSIGMFADQIRSKVKADQSVVVDISAVTLAGSEKRSPRSVLQSLENLDRSFQTVFKLVGATPKDQEELRQAAPLSRILPDDMIWHTHLRGPASTIVPPQGKPVVGLHSDSNQYRWPNSLEQFQLIYLSENFTTKFYGQVKQPLERFGPDINERINIVTSSAQSEVEFLASIDFWVYYPQDRLVEDIWEPVLAAFQAGKVVILPPHLEAVYDGAAVYSEPDRVSEIISWLAHDREQYIAYAAQGQRFFQRTYTASHFKRRVEALLDSSPVDSTVDSPSA